MPRRPAVAAALLALCLATATWAQRLPAERVGTPDPKVAPEKGTLTAAKDALKEGRLRDALPMLFTAMGQAYDRGPVLEALLEGAATDADARALWGLALAQWVADDKGKSKLAREIAKQLAESDKHIDTIVRSRAAAAREAASLALTLRQKGKKLMDTRLGARWAADLFWELTRPSPSLVQALAPEAERALADWAPDPRPVLAALQKVAESAHTRGDVPTAVRAARILLGIAAQARFDDLGGPKPPDLTAAAAAARRVLDRARTVQLEQLGAPLTLEQLRAFTDEERGRFTTEHSDFKKPGVAISPTGLYRVETCCGFETLLGVTETIEMHHRRLEAWFGRDPCAGRKGIVRIVPDAAGLEAEGTPFWWAGGFQGGDVTTVQFSVGNIEGLGHTLTHELTHRFDGASFSGLPAWIVEGRAVWTAAAYGAAADPTFVPNHLSVGTVEAAFIKGYGSQEKLEKLITGTIEDYRDNYVAGYALWAYLMSWEVGGKRLYAAQLEQWMKNAVRGINKPLPWFTAHFADGLEGRPKGMKEFAEQWAAFLQGCYWRTLAPWLSRYTRNAGGAGSPWVYDSPTWHRQRARAEPWLGQDQALLAGDLFLELGLKDDATLAYLWSLEVDEWTPRLSQVLGPLLEESDLESSAWILRVEDSRREFAAQQERPPTLPAPEAFARSFAKVRELMDELASAAKDYTATGQLVAAGALAADHDRLATFLGEQPLAQPVTKEAVLGSMHALDEPGSPLGQWGWIEDGLTDHEERRVPGLWYSNEDGDVFVGRTAPVAGSEVDRGLWQRDAFVRSREWQAPGRYSLKTRIFFMASFVSGEVILGYTRRDRNLRFHFGAGDYAFSIGDKDEAAKLKSIGWSLGDLRGRDGGLDGSVPGGTFNFDEEKNSFRLELLVDGAEVHAFIEDQWVGTYHTIDGRPIEGHIGFATDWGSVQVQQPVLRRLDRGATAGLEGRWPRGLDTQHPSTLALNQLQNRRVHGVPLGDKGTLVAWLPELTDLIDGRVSDEDFVIEALDTAARCQEVLTAGLFPMKLVLVVPTAYGEAARADLAQKLGALPSPVPLVAHHHENSLFGAGDPQDLFSSERTALLLIDEHGILRGISQYFAGWKDFQGPLGHWARVLRGRS